MSSFQIISVHLRLPLFNFTQWKDKCASYSFTTKKLTHSMCQVSLVVMDNMHIESQGIRNESLNQFRTKFDSLWYLAAVIRVVFKVNPHVFL